ncbi:hypothetical protein H257_17014 [Aphanomyces astaci]|uniref:Mitochondrial carrier protein n=1 Tax=Aphanomyces astaci TaxID=112090 RepID=W4FIP0_APHAT|nr:hypothetical protein H257_17014 [Aphanomyces astaci]ETV66583.1 hypothetical protein H257_17014 [Aphanomyces astaci]RQM11745.1 hypothetical protein B5M09_004482 [Aphanomyces astaci]|eukprot:XP_009843954.1 hypothetical protein H257_17014 [Aphanomyces astaci]
MATAEPSSQPSESTLGLSLKKSLAASTGAMITSLFVTPLDVAKVRLQSQSNPKQHRPSPSPTLSIACRRSCGNATRNMMSSRPHTLCVACVRSLSMQCSIPSASRRHLHGTTDALRYVFRTEGLRGLFAGLPPTLMLAIPSTVLYYTSYDHLVHEGARLFPELAPLMPLLAGSSARIVAATVVSPLELVRTRMQNGVEKNMVSILRKAVQDNGVRSLTRGLQATLARDVPFSAIYWTCYEQLKARLMERPEFDQRPVHQAFCAGAAAGMLAATVTTPFDVVKTLQQVDVSMQLSTSQVLRRLVATQGVAALMTGLTPRIAKIVPSCAIMISTYEVGKMYLGVA